MSHYKSSGRHEGSRPDLSLRISFEIKPVGIVDDTIEHSIPDRGIWKTGKPIRHRDLGSDQGRDAPEAVVEDLEQVLGILRGDRVPHPVIQDEQVEFGQAGEQGGVGAILVRMRQLVEQPQGAEVTHRIIASTRS